MGHFWGECLHATDGTDADIQSNQLNYVPIW